MIIKIDKHQDGLPGGRQLFFGDSHQIDGCVPNRNVSQKVLYIHSDLEAYFTTSTCLARRGQPAKPHRVCEA